MTKLSALPVLRALSRVSGGSEVMSKLRLRVYSLTGFAMIDQTSAAGFPTHDASGRLGRFLPRRGTPFGRGNIISGSGFALAGRFGFFRGLGRTTTAAQTAFEQFGQIDDISGFTLGFASVGLHIFDLAFPGLGFDQRHDLVLERVAVFLGIRGPFGAH